MTRFLSVEEVLFLHADQIANYGGSVEIRDLALLESAVAQPKSTFEGKELHSGLFAEAAAYLYHICSNHPFLDGNKRTALAAALVFLELNGVVLDDPDQALYEAVMEIARGQSSKESLAALFVRLAQGAADHSA